MSHIIAGIPQIYGTHFAPLIFSNDSRTQKIIFNTFDPSDQRMVMIVCFSIMKAFGQPSPYLGIDLGLPGNTFLIVQKRNRNG